MVSLQGVPGSRAMSRRETRIARRLRRSPPDRADHPGWPAVALEDAPLGASSALHADAGSVVVAVVVTVVVVVAVTVVAVTVVAVTVVAVTVVVVVVVAIAINGAAVPAAPASPHQGRPGESARVRTSLRTHEAEARRARCSPSGGPSAGVCDRHEPVQLASPHHDQHG